MKNTVYEGGIMKNTVYERGIMKNKKLKTKQCIKSNFQFNPVTCKHFIIVFNFLKP